MITGATNISHSAELSVIFHKHLPHVAPAHSKHDTRLLIADGQQINPASETNFTSNILIIFTPNLLRNAKKKLRSSYPRQNQYVW